MKPVVFAAIPLFFAACSFQTETKVDKPTRSETSYQADTSKNREWYSRLDYNHLETGIVEGIPVRVQEIGSLNVPSGKIVVCDPLVVPNRQPFMGNVEPGKYPVKIYMAVTNGTNEVCAAVKLEIKPGKADRWLLALTNDQDISQLKEETDYMGFSVDGAVAGMFDHETAKTYNEFIDRYNKSNPGRHFYIDIIGPEFRKNANPAIPGDAGIWMNYKLPGTNDLNVTMFQSGYGDGVYPAYWGLTADSQIISLMIDFRVLEIPEED